MSEMDFSDLGREIEEKVNKFINSKEMKDLQENIRQTVESTMYEVKRTAKDAADYVNKNVEIRWESSPSQSGASPDKAGVGQTAAGKAGADKKAAGKTASDNNSRAARTSAPKPYGKRQLPIVKRPQGSVSGVVMSVTGTVGAVVGWSAALIPGILSFVGGSIFEILGWTGAAGVAAVVGNTAMAGVAGIAAIFTAVAAAGGVLRRRARRFKSYVKTMGAKDFYSIEGLAQTVGKKEKYVIRDLKKMIQRGWFKEGHLDEQETCFMLTDESYQMYLDAKTELEQRKKEEERLAKEREELEQDPVRKQLKMTIEEGNEYIRRIRIVNDEIPGEEISGKLYRLERVCTRIFEHVEEKPEKLSDIRKFMNYYLPTTLKLVEKYYEFDTQPVQGENITTARKEIEDTLDNINAAFEKMFDKLFAEDAMDVSTDISVLSTMLAQEGLLEDEFK